MAKKNKSRKARKQADQKLQKMKVGHLVQKGEALLASDNFREALKVLKIAHQKQPADQPILSLLVRAYAGREHQLRVKGLVREADALHRQCEQYRPDPSQMNLRDLVVFMESTGVEHAIRLYNGFLAAHPPDVEAETVLAGKLLSDTGLKAADQLSEKALLKPELPIFQEAMRLMNDAAWEAALEHLRPVTRRSPLAPVKLLCRAMVCFYQNDDSGMQRALTMMPEAFARRPLIQGLQSNLRLIAPLWEGRFVTLDQTQSMLQTVTRSGYGSIATRAIKQLAAAMRPQDTRSAIEQLLLALWPLTTRGGEIDIYDLADLADDLLPGAYGGAIAAKIHFLGFRDMIEDTDTYLELLDEEFPDPTEHGLAASMVLSASVDWINGHGLQRVMVNQQSDVSKDRLGIKSRQPECMLLEMTLRALEWDPRNSQASDLLARLPRSSRKAKQLAEMGLMQVVDDQPDDPQPCLALAELNFEKNAYRKAQTYLKQAEHRAPHDEQVKDFMTLALLKSIDANLKREKHHLVKADLEKANARCGNNTLAQVTARQILFEMAQTGQRSLFGDGMSAGNKQRSRAIIDGHINALPDAEALKVLGLLAADSQQRPTTWKKTDTKALEATFRSRAATLDPLSSTAIRKVLLPDAVSFPLPFGQLSWLDGFTSRYKKILNRLGDADVLPVLDLWLEGDRYAQCLQEIRRRLKTATEPFHNLLLFYRMVVQSIDGQEPADGEAFTELIDRVPPQHLELFRTASQRLSKLARGPLKLALEQFRFENLDEWVGSPEDFDDLEMDLLDDLDSAMMDNPIEMMIGMVEAFVDLYRLRGATETTIKKQRNELMNDYQAKRMFGEIAEMIPPAMAAELSPEARYLIFG